MKYSTKNLMDRQRHFDYLRVFAIFAVMILHVSGQNWYATDVNRMEWQTFNFYDSIVRWGVPVFVMISGALFLPRNISIKTIYSKYVLRMVTSYIVWTGIYAAFTLMTGSGDKTFVDLYLSGYYHMWFIPMIIGIYMCIPLIKKIVSDEITLKYFLFLSFIFVFFIPEIVTLANDFAPEIMVQRIQSFNNHIINKMNLHMVMGYVFYFVLGYYLNRVDLNKKKRCCVYLLGIIGFTLTIFLNLFVALTTQTHCGTYYGNFTINVMFESVAVFIFFKNIQFKNDRIYSFIVMLSNYSFGAYLVHALVLDILKQRGLNTLSFHPVISVPTIGIIVFIASFAVSAIFHKIPKLKKYIV